MEVELATGWWMLSLAIHTRSLQEQDNDQSGSPTPIYTRHGNRHGETNGGPYPNLVKPASTEVGKVIEYHD